jgi:signal transduction histidine kinase
MLLSNLEQRDARTLARHSRAELAEAERLVKLIVDVETGQRGFTITRDERFLAPWAAARRAFLKEAGALASFADEPVQARRARRMAQDGTSYIRDYSVPLVNAARRNAPAARSIAVIEEGKRRVDALRAEFDVFTRSERAAVAAFQHRVDTAAYRSLVVAAGGLGLSMVLVALFAGYLARAVILPVRRAAAMAGSLAGGDLAVRMPETGTGEVGELERSFNTMGSSLEASRDELRQLAGEQGALRRVATLVAHAVPPSEVWGAVVAEVDQLLTADTSALLRYEADGTATLLAVRSRLGTKVEAETSYTPEGEGVVATVMHTGRPARLDTIGRDPSSLAAPLRELGIRSEVGAPIVVEGHLWGVIVAAWTEQESRPGTEARIAEFTELVATAIANAESRSALTASRARVVATADETRRRIERDLHDGAQQRLVHTIISLKLARRELGDGDAPGADLLAEALEHAELANAQLRELVRGILPAVLRRGGLRAGMEGLASRASLPVSADVTAERLPPALEATAYFIVAEALTNVVKHAGAGRAQLRAFVERGTLHIEVRDDGVGGARLEDGSGLLGLHDRAAALNGELRVESPPGGGTVITATLPVPSS